MSDYEYLAHYGTKGMHWGDRRYQTKDGSLTPLGRIHYGIGEARKKASDTAKKTAESARKTMTSAKNAAKAAPKKAGKALKNAPKATARAVKNTYSDLVRQRREHVSAKRLRKQARLKEKIEERRQKLMVKESKRTLRELDAELTRQGLENLIKSHQLRVDKLNAKNDMLREAAMLKEQERALKREAKTLKRDAERDARKAANKKNSLKDIHAMSDEDIDKRLSRLKKEAQLALAESERDMPAGVKLVKDKMVEASAQAVGQLAKETITAFGKKYLSDADKDDLEVLTDRIRKELTFRKAQDEAEDYEHNRARTLSTRERDEADAELGRAVTRLENLRKVEDARTKMRTRAEEEADAALSRQATRLENMRKVEDARTRMRTRAQDEYDEERKKEAARIETQNRIMDAKREAKKRNSPDYESNSAKKERTDTFIREMTVRKEEERRAKAYFDNDVPIPEIAKRMNKTEDQVLDLLYREK